MLKIVLLLLLLFTVFVRPQSLYEESNKSSVKLNDVVATIDTLKITAGEFFYSYEYGPAFAKREKKSKDVYLKYMINEKLLALEGYSNRLMENKDVKSLFDDIYADVATEKMFKDKILSKVSVSNNELDSAIKNKQITLQLKWLFASSEQSIINLKNNLDQGIPFDSLFNLQLNDSVFANDRELNTNVFDLANKNPALAKIINSLNPGGISLPVHVDDGWYIFKYVNKWENILTSETEFNKLKTEVNESLMNTKIDSLSNLYVNKLMLNENPVIQRDAADISKYYIAEYILPPEVCKKWAISEKLDSILSKAGLTRKDDYKKLILAKGRFTDFTLNEFLKWFWNRDQYFKIPKDNFLDFSFAMEKIIWQMVRDAILTHTAKNEGYFDDSWVKMQSSWWKDKIAFSAERNEINNSILLNYEQKGIPSNFKKSKEDYLSGELTKKILHKLIELKRKVKVNINQNVLDKIKVSSEKDPKSIDVYFVKKGSMIPRNPFPSINAEWAAWE